MRANNIRSWWLVVFFVGGSPTAIAAQTSTGGQLEADGAPAVVVNAGDAIRLTCGALANAGGFTLTGGQGDLFRRCNQMVQSVGDDSLATTNTFGFRVIQDRFNAIYQFSGEEVSSQSRYATESSNRQFANIGARMDAIRLGSRATGGGLAFNMNGVDVARSIADSGADRDAAARLVGGAASADADTGWAWFANAGIGFGDRDSTFNESGFEYDAYGVTVGVDYAFGNGLTVGGALGYSNYSADLDEEPIAGVVSRGAGGDIDSDGYTFSAFFVYTSGPQYINGIISYSRSDFDMERRVVVALGPDASGTALADGALDRTLKSSTDSDLIATQITAGREFQLGSGAITLDLYAGFDYQKLDIDGFEESERDNLNQPGVTPGLALVFDDQDVDSFQSIVGVMLRRAVNTGFGVLVPYAGVEWRHEFSNDSRDVDYAYKFAVTPVSFRTPTDDADSDFFELTAGLSAQFANRLFGFVQYNYTAGLRNVNANLVTIGLRGTF
jgi:outer membrane lipase/esterase